MLPGSIELLSFVAFFEVCAPTIRSAFVKKQDCSLHASDATAMSTVISNKVQGFAQTLTHIQWSQEPSLTGTFGTLVQFLSSVDRFSR